MLNKALALGSLVLVTGANGYIGSYIVVQLLDRGYRVRGTARDISKLDVIKEIIEKRNLLERFEGVVVPDMAAEGAFEGAISGKSSCRLCITGPESVADRPFRKDCAGVIHVASDLSRSSDPNKVISAVQRGVLNALKAAASASTIKRFVLTSSALAAIHSTPDVVLRIDSNSWNETDVKAAWEPPPYEASRSSAVYSASKAQGERAAWDFMEKETPHFTLNTVLPYFNVGPILSDKQPGSSAALINGLYLGDTMATQVLQSLQCLWMVNVEDTARLHVAALLEADVENERLFACAEPFNYSRVVKVLQEIHPAKAAYPPRPGPEGKDLSTFDTHRAEELLRRAGQPGLIGLTESLRAQLKG